MLRIVYGWVQASHGPKTFAWAWKVAKGINGSRSWHLGWNCNKIKPLKKTLFLSYFFLFWAFLLLKKKTILILLKLLISRLHRLWCNAHLTCFCVNPGMGWVTAPHNPGNEEARGGGVRTATATRTQTAAVCFSCWQAAATGHYGVHSCLRKTFVWSRVPAGCGDALCVCVESNYCLLTMEEGNGCRTEETSPRTVDTHRVTFTISVQCVCPCVHPHR